MQNIDIYDYLLLPIYLFFFYALIKLKVLKYPDADLRNICLIAFSLRMFGSFAYAMMIQYYYGYGDSFGFYFGSNFFTDELHKDISNIRYFFASASEVGKWFNFETGDNYNTSYMSTASNLFVHKLAVIVSYISFNKYLIMSLFFGLFSFAGQWKLFKVFNDINKGKNLKLMAFMVLYTPSIWFWGSGLIKDSICLGATGFIVHLLYKSMVKKKFKIMDIFYLLILIYIVFSIKSYIIIIFSVALSVTVFFKFIRFIKNIVFRSLLIISFFFAIAIFSLSSNINNQIQVFAQETKDQLVQFRNNYNATKELEETSTGLIEGEEIDASIEGLILHIPVAIFTCLFRPFIWERLSFTFLITSLESTLLLFFTLYLLYKTRFLGFFKIIFNNEYILFCLIISLLFAMIIGFTTYNFGTMVRYKIILLPFYYFMLTSIYQINQQNRIPKPVNSKIVE